MSPHWSCNYESYDIVETHNHIDSVRKGGADCLAHDPYLLHSVLVGYI